jgi:hypothetical protein
MAFRGHAALSGPRGTGFQGHALREVDDPVERRRAHCTPIRLDLAGRVASAYRPRINALSHPNRRFARARSLEIGRPCPFPAQPAIRTISVILAQNLGRQNPSFRPRMPGYLRATVLEPSHTGFRRYQSLVSDLGPIVVDVFGRRSPAPVPQQIGTGRRRFQNCPSGRGCRNTAMPPLRGKALSTGRITSSFQMRASATSSRECSPPIP